jgi:hypothetical protein
MEWLSMLSSTVPSEWARNLVRGAYDLYVHVAPDVMRRRVTDVQLARRCGDAGLAGFVLKSHYVPTAERAAVVNEALGGEVRVLGALALNASVGGLNPLAVEIAAREGPGSCGCQRWTRPTTGPSATGSRRALSRRRGWPSSKI